MYGNVGKKIQTLAQMLFVIGLIVSVILGIMAGCALGNLRIFGSSSTLPVFVAFLTIGLGILFSWLGQMCLFAFGKIAESCEFLMRSQARKDGVVLPGYDESDADEYTHRCFGCGASIDNGATLCDDCIRVLTQNRTHSGSSNTSAHASSSESAAHICPVCGTEIPAGARFCPACGAKKVTPPEPERRDPSVQAVPVCRSCGMEVDADAVFCPGCGAKLSRF